MPRPPRINVGGMIYHVVNRANAGLHLFHSPADYQAFEEVLGEAGEGTPMRVLAYCLMPTHWHLVLWPEEDGDLSRYLHWATLTHTQRWHAYRNTAGSGHLYQSRFKSFVVEQDEHFLTVCRYVERNPLRAGLVRRAEEWRWCSLRRRLEKRTKACPPLTDWPVPLPAAWGDWVNEAQSQAELSALRVCAKRGQPFGSEAWRAKVVRQFGLEPTLRPRGRPRR